MRPALATIRTFLSGPNERRVKDKNRSKHGRISARAACQQWRISQLARFVGETGLEFEARVYRSQPSQPAPYTETRTTPMRHLDSKGPFRSMETRDHDQG